MADLGTGQNLFQDWYDTYVLPKKNTQIEGVFRRGDKPDWSLGLPKSPTPAPTASVATPAASPEAAPVETPEAPEVPLTDYTTQPPATSEATDPSWLDKISTGMRESKGMSPGAMGILGMGLSMAATPPRAIPYSTTEIIGRSGLAGLGVYEKALDDKRRQDAMDISAEEHRLSREDRRQYNLDRAENMRATRANEALRINELNELRSAREAGRTAETAKLQREEARRQEEVPIEILEDRKQDHMAGITWEDYKAAGYDKADKASTEKAKADKFIENDMGDVTVIRDGKPIAVFNGMGRKTKPPAGGSEKLFQYQDRKALESLKQKGIDAPTNEQIAAERQILFPKGTPKAAGRNPWADATGSGAEDTRGLNGKTYKKKNGKWYEM